MTIQRKRRDSKMTRGMKGIIALLVLVLAFGLLLFQLFSSVLYAFSVSYWVGVRSLAAALFPLTVAIYLAFLARMQVPARESRAPIINNFIIFIFWTMIVLGLDSNNDFEQFPLEELLYSCTLAVMILRYKNRDSSKELLACCYGVLSGSLAAVILFGMNPATL